jgi:hypothetical protein
VSSKGQTCGFHLQNISHLHHFRSGEMGRQLFSLADESGSSIFKSERAVRVLRTFSPNDLDVGDGKAEVSIDVSAPGTQHPAMFATHARADDIGCRLAFQVTGKGSDGKTLVYTPHLSGRNVVAKANTFLDLLVHEATWDEIARLGSLNLIIEATSCCAAITSISKTPQD